MNGLIRKKSQHVLFNMIIPRERDVCTEEEGPDLEIRVSVCLAKNESNGTISSLIRKKRRLIDLRNMWWRGASWSLSGVAAVLYITPLPCFQSGTTIAYV